MRVFHCDHHEVFLPPRHRFPMGKYRQVRAGLLAAGLVSAADLVPAPPAPLERVRAVHAAAYVEAFLTGTLDAAAQRRLGFPWSRALVGRALASTGGTLAAARAALDDGIAGVLAGGTHHAHADFGAGYCTFNDIAIAARTLLDERHVARVLVVDVDVHQGDGTAAIFAEDARVFTCSLHGARNFPRAKIAGDLDVALPDGTDDDAYLAALDEALERAFAHAPDLLFVQAGVDVLAADRLGRLALSEAGVVERDRRILARAWAAGVPAVLTLGGGYAEPIALSVRAHVGTYRAAHAVHAPPSASALRS